MSTYTNAFAFTQLCGVLCAPWNGLILDYHKRNKAHRAEGNRPCPPSLLLVHWHCKCPQPCSAWDMLLPCSDPATPVLVSPQSPDPPLCQWRCPNNALIPPYPW